MYSLSKLTSKYPAVRNQGTYNTCWAFSAAGLAEFDLITDNKSATSSINLSEAQIA
jgi:C1A family cysteine protease